jgi:hypothetical protein
MRHPHAAHGGGLRGSKEAAAFLKKSGAKNFWLLWARGVTTSTAQINKSFLLLFFKKEALLFPSI